MRGVDFRRYSLTVLTALLAAFVGLVGKPAFAQPTIKFAPAPYTSPTSGAEMFKEYCSACHGASGKGDGPAVPALKNVPTDLTRLSANNKGKFPEINFQEIMKSGTTAAHGGPQMPVWGQIFSDMKDRSLAVIRIRNLMDYVKTIQVN